MKNLFEILPEMKTDVELFTFDEIDKNFSMPGVYIIINNKNSRYYIGSSKNVRRRIKTHIRQLKKENSHHSIFFKRDFMKSGLNEFLFGVLEKPKVTDLLKCEQTWLDNFFRNENCYNVFSVADRPAGISPTLETRIKLSIATKKRFEIIEERENISKKLLEYNKTQEAKEMHKNRIRKSVESNEKYFSIVDPEGVLIQDKNISKFARENGLSYYGLWNLLFGKNKREHHKGYRRPEKENIGIKFIKKKHKRTREGEARRISLTKEKLSKKYNLISPDGIVHKGKNIKNFSKKHGLRYESVCLLVRGITKKHKNWKKNDEDN